MINVFKMRVQNDEIIEEFETHKKLKNQSFKYKPCPWYKRNRQNTKEINSWVSLVVIVEKKVEPFTY